MEVQTSLEVAPAILAQMTPQTTSEQQWLEE